MATTAAAATANAPAPTMTQIVRELSTLSPSETVTSSSVDSAEALCVAVDFDVALLVVFEVALAVAVALELAVGEAKALTAIGPIIIAIPIANAASSRRNTNIMGGSLPTPNEQACPGTKHHRPIRENGGAVCSPKPVCEQ
jgi:hypothetical protein